MGAKTFGHTLATPPYMSDPSIHVMPCTCIVDIAYIRIDPSPFPSLHGVSNFLQIIRSRYEPPKFKSSDKITQGPSMSFAPIQTKDEPEFQLKHLEEDLVRLFNAGKPLIESPSSIRTLFKFKQSISPDVTVPDE